MKEKEIISIDFLRVISGFFVVFIHVSDHFILFNGYVGGLSWNILYVLNVYSKVAVPLFMLISGYLLLNPGKLESTKQFLSKRLNKVGIPAAFWIGFFFIWQAIWEKASITPEYVIQKFYEVNFGPLYFLIVILELYLLAPLFLFLLRKYGKYFLLFLFGLSFLGGFVPRFVLTNYDISESIFTIWIPFAFFFGVGGYISMQKIKISKLILITLFIAFGAASIFLSGGNIVNGFINYSSPTIIGMSISLFLLVILLEKAFLSLNSVLKKLVKAVAGCVFGIYLLHPFIINVLFRITDLKPGSVLSPIWINVILISLLVTFLSLSITYVFRKIPIARKLFG